jgi:DNA recombination protein RmuC
MRQFRLGRFGIMHTTYIVLIALAGVVLGSLVTWLRARVKIVRLETTLQHERGAVEEKLNLMDHAKETLGDAFKALSSDVLKSSNEEFLQLARLDLEKRQEAVDHLVAPIKESLEKVEVNIRNLETAREGAYKELLAHVKQLAGTQRILEVETVKLVNALKSPPVGGFWGEIQLRRIVELSGMKRNYDFVEQKGVTDEDKRFIPDLIVNLPGNKCIVVDAKVSTKAFLEAMEADTDAQRDSHLSDFAGHLKGHIDTLKSKKYWERVPNSTEFVVMFLPGENFLQAALAQDPTLTERGFESNVILATPTILISLLKTVAYGWRQEEIAENAIKIRDVGSKLYKRLRTFIGHFEGIKRGLDSSTDAYNRAVGSLESRVLPAAREMTSLGVGDGNGFDEVKKIEKSPRSLQAPELNEDEDST